MKQGDVRLFENGQPQEITAFSRQVDLPLSLAILIDVSVSQQRTLPEESGCNVVSRNGNEAGERRSIDNLFYR